MKTSRKSRAWLFVGAALLLVLLAALAYIFLLGRGTLPSLTAPGYWPTHGWQTTTPEEQGLDSTVLAAGIQSVHDNHTAIDSLLIIRNGSVVLDAYFAPYDGSFPHDLGSVTKSVTTTLIGIAIDQGKLTLDQPVISFFSKRTIANLNERKKSLTVRDLVSMRNGMESQCFHGDEATLDAMRSQPDWVQAALDRKMTSQPDTQFCYDSPGMHILSAILQEVTGMTEFEYARKVLLGPLGIQDAIWESDPQGYSHGWGDLHLKPTDAAKLGYLWLHGGQWEGKQIVSAGWVTDSIQAHSRLVGNEYGYGYGMWVSPVDFYAMGRGGQYIRVISSANAVVVVTAGGPDIDFTFLAKVLLGAPTSRLANPAGENKLAQALSEASQGPGLHPPSPLPDMAMFVSGKTYVCEDNSVGVTRLQLDFNDPKVAEISMAQHGQQVLWPVGLDGKYRLSDQGQAQAGYWENAQTFTLEVFDIGQLIRRFHFDGNRLEVTIPEAALTLNCQFQNP